MDKEIEELNKIAAYIKNKPITEASQMTNIIECVKMDEEWLAAIKGKNDFWYTGFTGKLNEKVRASQLGNPKELERLKKIFELRDRLLTFGGEQVCLPTIEEDLEDIMERGQLWYGDRIKMMKGESCQCHYNSCMCWDDNKDKVRIATGYALSKDGMFRQHSWLIWIKPRKNIIIETTQPRVAYFGFVMTEAECEKFYTDTY